MVEMVYDRRLEHIARKHAKKCQTRHSEKTVRNNSHKKFKKVGEKI